MNKNREADLIRQVVDTLEKEYGLHMTEQAVHEVLTTFQHLKRQAGGGKWLKITPDGKVTEVRIGSIEQMYEQIGCDMVQMVKGESNAEVWLDEEGKFDSTNSPNWLATLWCWYDSSISRDDYIMGTALIGLTHDDYDDEGRGRTVHDDLPEGLADKINGIARNARPQMVYVTLASAKDIAYQWPAPGE